MDLDTHFDDLFTIKWMQSSIPVDTITVTLEDYFQDYNHLTSKNFEYVITEAQNLVCKKYITAMLSRRLTFKTMEENQTAVTKILKENNQIKAFFLRIAPEVSNMEWPFEIINMLAEVISFLFINIVCRSTIFISVRTIQIKQSDLYVHTHIF